MSKTKFTFPVGYHDFHKDQLYNFQLNRWYSLGYARLEDMEKDKMHAWTASNLMYIADKKTLMDAADVAMQLNAKNLHSELVTQNVLILTGREDHFIPFKMHGMQVKALTNARSVTSRIFTREEEAQNHCQIGNIGLVLDVMVKWIEEKS